MNSHSFEKVVVPSSEQHVVPNSEYRRWVLFGYLEGEYNVLSGDDGYHVTVAFQ